jgi:hypothetical protein
MAQCILRAVESPAPAADETHVSPSARKVARATAVIAHAVILACGGSAGTTTTAADSTAFQPPPPSPALSRFDVPLDFEFTSVVDAVERAVPRKLGSIDRKHQLGDNARKHYAFEAVRDSFIAFAHGANVHLRTTLSYQARGYYDPPLAPAMSAGCGDDEKRPRIVIELVAPLTLSSDWRLKSRASISQLSAASDSTHDHCRVSFLQINVTDRVIDAARNALTQRLPDIDARVARIDITKKATGWWTSLSNPIRLADDVWLLLQPRQIRLGDVTGDGQVLTIEAGLDAYPMIVTGPRPSPQIPPLPPIASGASTTGFSVLVDVNVDYRTASSTFTKELGGRTIARSGRTVSVKSITASAVGGRLALDVDFEGDASGSLRLIGTPRFDPRIGQILVPDLDYDLSTDSKLVNAYAWLRSDELREMFRERARLPIEPVKDQGKALVLKGINRTIKDQVTLAGTVDSVAILGLYVLRSGLLVRATADGDARVAVRPRPKPKNATARR